MMPVIHPCPICRQMAAVYQVVTDDPPLFYVQCKDFKAVKGLDMWQAKRNWNREVEKYLRKVSSANGRAGKEKGARKNR